MKYTLFTLLFLVSFSSNAQDKPAPRHLESATYSVTLKKLFVSAGSEMDSAGKWQMPADLFEWNGKDWKKFAADKGPGSRRAHTLIFDEAEKLLWVMGGVTDTPKGDSLFSDAWTWNGSTWQLRNVNCPLKEPSGIYDPTNTRILVYGKGEKGYELWQLRNNKYEKLSDTGPTIDGLSHIAWDDSRQTLVIPNWSSDKSEVWEFKSGKWTKIVCAGPCPEARNRHTVAYLNSEKATYLFSGRNNARDFMNDLWKWDGQSWKQVQTANVPPVRAAANLVSTGKTLLLYGGTVTANGKSVLSNEIWVFDGKDWTKK